MPFHCIACGEELKTTALRCDKCEGKKGNMTEQKPPVISRLEKVLTNQDTLELKQAFEQARQETAREIFEEIEKNKSTGGMTGHFDKFCIVFTDIKLQALKNKFIGGEDERTDRSEG